MNQLQSPDPQDQYATRLLHVQIIFLIAFLLVIAMSALWGVLRAPEMAAREDNPRLVEAELRLERGRILDTAEQVLAQSVADENGRFTREYPSGQGEPVIGYYSLRHGTAGIEASMDEVLRGTTTESNWAQIWRELSHQPRRGRDVRLTLRADLQQAADELLAGQQGTAVLISLNDNAVRVMSSQPSYDPNLLNEQFEALVAAENAPLLNRATQGQYQPGLILAPFIMAGAVDDGFVSLNRPAPTAVLAPLTVDGERLTCQEDLPPEATWADALRARCPAALPALGDVGLMAEQLEAYWEAFGLTTAPDIPLEVWEPEERIIQNLTRALLGQEGLTVTPLQVALALAVLGQEGQYEQARLISAVADEAGVWQGVSRTGEVAQRVVAPATADAIRAALPISEGGRFIEYESVAPSGPNEQTTAWYMALAPANSPRYALVLVLENQDNTAVARAIGRQLLEKTLE